MDHFSYRNGVLHAEEVSFEDIAKQFGTPCFVYARATLERHYKAFDQALAGLEHRVCYAVKANSNLAVLDVLARLGSSFDIVSGGELARLQALDIPGDRVVFSGVGKSAAEIEAALRYGVHALNVESTAELDRIASIASKLDCVAPIALRVNPDVDAKTHPYIATGLKENKFGISMDAALATYQKAQAHPALRVVGLDCHIGSQLTDLAPYTEALDRLLQLVDALEEQGIHLEHLDLGGGLGIRYRDETPPDPAAWGEVLRQRLQGRNLAVYIEPGRAIAGHAGMLLTRVEYLKPTAHKNFAVVDAAMTELMRPTLYQAWHDILPVRAREEAAQVWDVVGPVCETGDWLGKERELSLAEGDLLAVRSAGAYAAAMNSHYNTRPHVAEVLVDGTQLHLARAAETVESIFQLERRLPV